MALPAIIIQKCGNLSFVVESDELAVEGALSRKRLFKTDMRRISGKSFVVRLLEQPSIKTG